MDARRLETAPILLWGLATAALLVSGTAIFYQEAPSMREVVQNTAPRTLSPLRWTLGESSTVVFSSLPLRFGSHDSDSLKIAPPSFDSPNEDDPLWLLTADDLRGPLLAFPTRVLVSKQPAAEDLVIYLPSPPRLSAAHRGPSHNAWEVFGWDSLGAIKHLAQRWEAGALFQEGVSLSFVPRRFDSRVATTEYTLPTIATYLATGPQGGLFPIPVALGEQLDRLATLPEGAGWAWAVAYRVRGLVAFRSATTSDAQRSLAVLTEAAAEAQQMAEATADPTLAAELRRARYAIDRRVSAWDACLAQSLALSHPPTTRLASQKWLESARWAMSQGQHGLLLRDPNIQEPMRLAAQLESFETFPSGPAAQRIAQEAARLAEQGDAEGKGLADAVEQNYRNANLRIAIATELVGRIVEQPEALTSSVRDRVAGTPVRGRSTTRTEMKFLAIPDPSSWRLGIEATGSVLSDTVSHGGPARLRSIGRTNFTATKQILVNPQGVHCTPTLANATRAYTRLAGISTKYDGIPMVGSYTRTAARKEYHRVSRQAGNEVEKKVALRVEQEIDRKAAPAITRCEQRYRDTVLTRAESLGLAIEPLEMRTTDTRLIGRVRIANEHQLAAHTPRMRAPADSLLSVQLHESTLNNAFEGLGLNGERFTTAQLHARIQERLQLDSAEPQSKELDRAVLRFAEEDPVRLDFRDGLVELTLGLDEMAFRGKRHGQFKVHVFYRPQLLDDEAWLVQEGTPQIEGRMRTASRIRLHGAFGKILSEARRMPLVRIPPTASPALAERLAGLTTTQLVIEDGWLGVAVGPGHANRIAACVGTYVR